MTLRQTTRWGRYGLLLVAALALAGCTGAPEGITSGTIADPYADLPDGSARYTGGLVGEHTAGVLPGTASAEGFSASAGDTVRFDEGQVALSDEARRIVTAQARWLNQNKGFTAVVEGHADEQGTREYNLALGARRAAAVQEYLIANGVDSGRVSTVSYGRERPLAACEDEECFARNRRVVTAVKPGAGA